MRTLPCAVNSRRDSPGNYPRFAVDRAGQMLREMDKQNGARGNPGGRGAKIVASADARAQPAALADFGISHTQSSRWQKLAASPKKNPAAGRG
jgi:hypothetical protein